MKCGLICARRARTSASISRVRLASSSASSSWPLTHCATSSAARARPAVACGENTWSVPTTRSSTTSGLTIAVRISQPGTSQREVARGRTSGCCRARRSRPRAGRTGPRGAGPAPCHASAAAVSVSASAGVPSRSCRCRRLRSALSRVQPGAQRRRGERGAVQRPERGAVGLGPEMAPAPRTGHAEHRRSRAQRVSCSRARPSNGCSGRCEPGCRSANPAICSAVQVTGSSSTVQATPSVHGGIVSDPS